MDNLIYDRTQEDIGNNTEKGYYNYTDLNRVEEWCEYLANTLNSYNYPVEITVKTNWTMLDFPTVSEMERIRNNIDKLKQAYYAFTSIPDNLKYMTIEKANDIEKILSEIDVLIKNMAASFRYSNTFNSGESEGLI